MPLEQINDISVIISAAKGEFKIDLLLVNCKIVNVFTGEVYGSDVAIHNGIIVGFGKYDAKKIINLKGAYLTPGFIDGHMHIESTMIDPAEFAKTVVPQGTTKIIADTHEIANVKGVEGIKYILRHNKLLPLDIYAMVPSCVPATNMETSGACLNEEDIKYSLSKDRILGLGELMNFPGVLEKNPHVLKKIKFSDLKRIDGHAPGIKGRDLYAYIAAGAVSDHECTTSDEALEKLRAGMFIMIREGSVTKDLEELLPFVTTFNMRRCLMVTDDREPYDLIKEGHINYLVKKAVKLGLDPAVAIALVTINPAEYFGLKNIGAIAPGYQADLVVIEDFDSLKIKMVFKKGIKVAENQKPLFSPKKMTDKNVLNTVNFKPIKLKDLEIKTDRSKAHVIELQPEQIVTKNVVKNIKIKDGTAVSDIQNDILKIVVIERHNATGNISKAFVKGFGFKKGAIATTVAHDSHNIICVGTNDRDMLTCINGLKKIQGGLIAVSDGKVLGALPLPIAGLMTDRPINEVSKKFENLLKIAKKMGDKTHHPFMTLSFLALPVIPEIKITDKGLIDVNQFKFIDLFVK